MELLESMAKKGDSAGQRVTDLQKDMSSIISELGSNREEFQSECDRFRNCLGDAHK